MEIRRPLARRPRPRSQFRRREGAGVLLVTLVELERALQRRPAVEAHERVDREPVRRHVGRVDPVAQAGALEPPELVAWRDRVLVRQPGPGEWLDRPDVRVEIVLRVAHAPREGESVARGHGERELALVAPAVGHVEANHVRVVTERSRRVVVVGDLGWCVPVALPGHERVVGAVAAAEGVSRSQTGPRRRAHPEGGRHPMFRRVRLAVVAVDSLALVADAERPLPHPVGGVHPGRRAVGGIGQVHTLVLVRNGSVQIARVLRHVLPVRWGGVVVEPVPVGPRADAHAVAGVGDVVDQYLRRRDLGFRRRAWQRWIDEHIGVVAVREQRLVLLEASVGDRRAQSRLGRQVSGDGERRVVVAIVRRQRAPAVGRHGAVPHVVGRPGCSRRVHVLPDQRVHAVREVREEVAGLHLNPPANVLRGDRSTGTCTPQRLSVLRISSPSRPGSIRSSTMRSNASACAR